MTHPRQTHNSLGHQISADQDQLLAFQEWFDAAMMVDAQNRPLAFFHGTGREFTIFQPNDKGLIFVTPNRERACEFAESRARWAGNTRPRVLLVYTNAKNAFDPGNTQHVGMVLCDIEPANVAAELAGLSGSEWTEQEAIRWVRNGEWQALETPEVLGAIKRLGFDAMHIHELGQKSLAVFDSRQIAFINDLGGLEVPLPAAGRSLSMALSRS